MPVTIDGLQLFGADESTNEADANVELTSVPTQNPDEGIAFSLEAIERNPLSGRATGLRLTQEPGYPSDPRDALAEWVQRFVSLVNSEQGDGWDLVDDERNRTITVAVTNASWTYNAGAEYEVQWDLEATRGDVFFTGGARSVSPVTASTGETLGGEDLGSVDQKRTSIDIQTNETAVAYQPRESSVITADSGAVRRVTLTGTKSDTQANLRSFDDTLRGWTPRENTLTYQTAMPGTSHEVVINNYSSTINAGSPATLDYSMELIEGNSL